ncbi:SET domain-containing protein [Meira miltonrushii]|uniref:SET domain-containing protein n=1 Tax=Meira miltonrushii TaxID=1280837 RepID=A0A316V146_9BASI|nr:SET domain-containing protein [Meira miltonrushii]PWN31269.1 SET domain-containing protein [Meira miltonrushii]
MKDETTTSTVQQTTLLKQSTDDDQRRISILLEWAHEKHIWIHDDIIIGRMEEINIPANEQSIIAKGEGYGIFLRKDSEPLIDRQILVLVPKQTILSAKTSSLSALIKGDLLFNHDAAAGLLLSTVLLHEFLLGEQGPWWGYLQSMPKSRPQKEWGISLPMHWKEESENECWRWIEHCESGRMIKRTNDDPNGLLEGIGMSLARLKKYFDQKLLPILSEAHPHLTMDSISTKAALWNDFIGMHSLVSSRSFVVDMYHGLALVPVSDMFNHSDDANVHFEADEDVCDECGELGMCPHNDDPLPSSAYGRPSAFLPAERGPNSIDWKAPEWLDGLETVDMVAQEQIDRATEAFNTYGLMSNSVLLTTYGFCLDDETEWERYGWEWRNEVEMKEICAAFKLQKDSKKRYLDKNFDDQNDRTASTLYDRWIKAFVSFTNLPLQSFAELYLSPMEIIRNQKDESEPGTPSLTMPITSPFLALMRSVALEELDRQIEPIMEEQDLSPSLQTFLSPLSMHDGSRDRYQPLFIDKEGQVSLPLFRIAVLASYVNDSDESLSEAKIIGESERLLDHIIFISETNDEFNESKWSISVIKILKNALQSILALIQSRRMKLYITQGNRQEDALRIIESDKRGSLRSAVLQAFQEAKALDITIDRAAAYLHLLNGV